MLTSRLLRRRMLLAVLTLSVATGLASRTDKAYADSKNPIMVGIITTLTGAGAVSGVPTENGIMLAIKQANRAGGINGRPIEVKVYDDEQNGATAATLAQRLIDVDNVKVIVGTPYTGTAVAVVRAASAKKIPVIVPIAQSPEVLQVSPTWAFRTSPNNVADIEGIIKFVKSKGWKKIGILYDTQAYGLSGKKILEDLVPKAGLQIAGEEAMTMNASDVTAQATKLKDSHPDVVIPWLSVGSDTARLVIDARAIGWTVPIVSGRSVTFDVFVNMVGKAAEGGVYSMANLDRNLQKSREFMDLYKKEYGDLKTIDYAAASYDAGRVLVEALKRAGAGVDDPAKIRDAIEAVKLMAVTGPEGSEISFSKDNHEGSNGNALVPLIFKDGHFVSLRGSI